MEEEEYENFGELEDDSNDTYSDGNEAGYADRNIIDVIGVYVYSILFVAGITGNLLCVTTLFDLLPTRIHLSVCVHLVALSALDSIVLCLRAGNDFVRCTWSFGVTEWILLQSDVTCQVFFFFSSFVQHLDSWIFVLAICQDASTVASDLLMTPTSSTTTKSRSAFSRAVNRSKHSILVVILFLVCANAHYFWTHGRWSPNPNEKNKALFCSFTQYGGMEAEVFREIVWPIANVILLAAAPIFVILICLAFRFYRLVYRRQFSALFTQHPQKQSQWHLQLQLMLKEFQWISVCLAIVGIVCSFPEMLYNIFEFILERRGQIENPDFEFMEQRRMAQAVSSMLHDFFLSFKLLVYIGFSSVFRQRLLQFANCFQRRKRAVFCSKSGIKQHPGAPIRSTNNFRRRSNDVISCKNYIIAQPDDVMNPKDVTQRPESIRP